MKFHLPEQRFPIGPQLLLVVGAALVAACGVPGDVERAPTEISSAPIQPPTGQTQTGTKRGELYSLSGVLTLRTTSGTSPLANAGVGGYVIKTSGESYGLTSVTTDANGRYEFSKVPSGVVVLYAEAPHASLPCVALGIVSGSNGVKNLELVDSAVTRPLTTADSPTLTGVVYRRTANGKQPIAGAVLEYEYSPVIATTAVTDAAGRFSLCQLPLGRGGVDVWLNGVSLGGAVFTITGDQTLDIDVTR